MTRSQKFTFVGLLVTAIVFIALIAQAWTDASVTRFEAIRFATSTKAWPEGAEVVVPYGPTITQTASNCVAVTATSAQFTLPTNSNVFRICAGGGLASYAFVSCGANPTATTTATTGYTVPPLADGQCIPAMEITEAKCAVIGGASVGGAAAAGGSVCFLEITSPGGSHQGQ